MKSLEELTPEELIALAREKQAELEAKEAELAQKEIDLANAKLTVDKLKGQVKEKKDLSGPKTRVKIDGDIYEFPSEKLTLPNHTHGSEHKTIDAKEASKDLTLSALLRDSGVLVKVA